MFVLYDHESYRVPIKVWLKEQEDIEESCLKQAENLARLPFVHKHVALMPDTHSGYGMPIGGVIATKGVVIPNAVGVDIGCGMIFLQTNLLVRELKEIQGEDGKFFQSIVGKIGRSIPTGFSKHQVKQHCMAADKLNTCLGENYHYPDFDSDIENMYYQVGTLGGGNHFIELQESDDGKLAIMIHSGSRNFGFKVANRFNEIAKGINNSYFSSVPSNYDLAFLPVDSEVGDDYLLWMRYALDFAKENRDVMMETVINILKGYDFKNLLGHDIEFAYPAINAHHNYVSLENHYGVNVWVHRKGAIQAKDDQLGIIPGAMGSYSYIVKGLQNPESFHSCSHGAGRRMSRKKATETFTTQQMMDDLNDKGVTLSVGSGSKDNVVDESRFAYKDIKDVMGNQKDLVEIVKTLKTVAVIKASESSKRK